MGQLVKALAIKILVLYQFQSSLQVDFPFIRQKGCAHIKSYVEPGKLWVITRWMKNQNTKPFKCFLDPYLLDTPLATQQSVFLATDYKSFAVYLTCLGEDSYEDVEGSASYLVLTYSNKKRPSDKVMKQILQAHKRNGLDTRFIKYCV